MSKASDIVPRKHDAWLVDLDGTLYTGHWVKLAMAAELSLSGFGSVRILRHFRNEHERMREEQVTISDVVDEQAIAPFLEQIERTARALKLEPALVEKAVSVWMIERPKKWITTFRRAALLREIEQFREYGGRTALVSDYPAREKLGALRADKHFDVVIANGEPDGPRRLKPHPDGFRRAAERLGIEPARCLVIGDRDDADGQAARALGMDFRLVK
jgi:HAD superfamily hydrolase (TIGR01549 family)